MGPVVSTLGAALTTAWFAHHQRMVHKWLDAATPDTILEALLSNFLGKSPEFGTVDVFLRGVAAKERIEGVFDTFGKVDEGGGGRYWNEQDFRLFVESRFPTSEVLTSCMPLLWRCFHFHAFFPFPRGTLEPIDFKGFQRAMAMLASDGTQRFGTDSMGARIWPKAGTGDPGRGYTDYGGLSQDHIEDGYQEICEFHNISRFFRSISVCATEKQPEISMSEAAAAAEEEDVLDVLALLQPGTPAISTVHRDELRPHARRMLGSSSWKTESVLPVKELGHLLRLLLSIQIDQPRRDGFNQRVCSVSTNAGGDVPAELLNAVLQRFSSDGSDHMGYRTFKAVLKLQLPNLITQLNLIFATLISSVQSPTEASLMMLQSSITSLYHAQYLSFFLPSALPYLKDHYNITAEFEHSEAQFAFQNPQVIYSASDEKLSIKDLASTLESLHAQTLLLITGEIINALYPPNAFSTRAIFGAYMPTTWDIQCQREQKADQGHVLFQLEPRFELLQPLDPENTWIADLIKIEPDSEARKGGLRFCAENGGSGLSVDFDTGISTLKGRSLSSTGTDKDVEKEAEQPRVPGYYNVGASHSEEEGNTRDDLWETSMRIAHLELHRLPGALPRIDADTLARRRDNRRRRTAYPIPSEFDKGVLAGRIEGFGGEQRSR